LPGMRSYQGHEDRLGRDHGLTRRREESMRIGQIFTTASGRVGGAASGPGQPGAAATHCQAGSHAYAQKCARGQGAGGPESQVALQAVSCGALSGFNPFIPGYPGLFQDLYDQIDANIFSAMRIGDDYGIIAPGHDIMLRSGVRAIESQFPQPVDQLSTRDWNNLTRQCSQAPQKP